MLFLRSFLIASLVPLLALGFCVVRLAQEAGVGPVAALTLPLERLAAGGLIEAARIGETQARLTLVILLSAALLMASLAGFAVAFLVSAAVGKNRVAMVAVMPAFAFLMLIVTTLFVIGDVGVLLGVVGASMTGADAAVTSNGASFYTVLLLAVGVLTVLGLIGALVRMFHIPAMGVMGVRAQSTDHPKILAFVEDVARRVDARAPQHVVLGMDLNFFATNAPIRPLGEGRLKGETLYLSLPCLRLLSEGELRAVVGHELGHFSGKDTAYSMAFAPAFHGLGEAVNAVRKPLWRIPNLLGLLASERLSYVAFLFHRNHGAASREREFAADQKGAEASNPSDLAAALIKMFILAQIWALQAQVNIGRLQRGRMMRNLSLSFAERVRYDAETLRLPELVKDALLYETAHPTDQHPRTSERIRALNVPVATVADGRAIGERLYPATPASTLLDDMRFAEEQLTRLVQRMWVGLGARPKDDSHDGVNALNNIFCQLFAHMVLADKIVDPSEIEVAEAEASTLVPDFDFDGFREFCRGDEPLVELDHLLEMAAEILTDSGKEQLITLLDHIAKADRRVVSEESAVLAKAREILRA
jgi:Zn-dependent protease with chaperone function